MRKTRGRGGRGGVGGGGGRGEEEEGEEEEEEEEEEGEEEEEDVEKEEEEEDDDDDAEERINRGRADDDTDAHGGTTDGEEVQDLHNLRDDARAAGGTVSDRVGHGAASSSVPRSSGVEAGSSDSGDGDGSDESDGSGTGSGFRCGWNRRLPDRTLHRGSQRAATNGSPEQAAGAHQSGDINASYGY